MKTVVLTVLVFWIISGAMGQNAVDLTFTAVNNGVYMQLDSIKVMNRTRGDSVLLYWPDTTLTYQISTGDLMLYIGYAMNYPVGIHSVVRQEQHFQLLQSYPNPVSGESLILLHMPGKGPMNIVVSDIAGRIVQDFDQVLAEGAHSFRFRPGNERIYFITARWNEITQNLKILTDRSAGRRECKFEYAGIYHADGPVLRPLNKSGLVVQESGILDTPEDNTSYTFQFATNIPCRDVPTVTYEGQVYNTIQIFNQCWLKENLNVGTMIDSAQNQANNNIIEKYCLSNNPDSCIKYGGLYQWNEMMQYVSQAGSQGICPPGWHVPTDEEWKVLEGAVDSQYGIGDSVWDLYSVHRGYDVGTNLKTMIGWYAAGSGSDLYGFSGLPGGEHMNWGFFYIYTGGYWWTSTVSNNDLAWERRLYFGDPVMFRTSYGKNEGLSVRCLQDY